MKKYIVVLTMGLLCIQLFCCPLAFAETTTTTAEDVGVTTTTAEEAEDTTTAPATTKDTAKSTTSTTVATGTAAQTTDNTTTSTEAAAATTTQGSKTVVETALIILKKGDKVAARVTDTAKRPIEGIRVFVQIGTTKMPGVLTNADGYADFQYTFPANGTYIYCYTEQTTIGNTVYKAAAATVGAQAGNTTAAVASKTTSTDAADPTTTVASTTQRTYTATTPASTEAVEALTTYTATGTTGVEESHFTLEFSYDSGILDAFKAEQNAFAKTAKLLLTPECYNKMLNGENGVLIMSAATSATAVTDEQITAAVADDAVLSSVDVSGVERIVMDLSVRLMDTTTGDVMNVWEIAEGDYVIQLPIPQSMRSAQTIAVAAVTGEGVSTPVYAHVSEEGFFRFESTSPAGTIVILGFKGSVLGTLTGDAVRSSVIFLVIGLLCIGGAIFLYFRFVHRPKKSRKQDEQTSEEAAADDAADLPPLDSEYETLDEGVELDIFADDTPTPLHRKSDPDIDIPL